MICFKKHYWKYNLHSDSFLQERVEGKVSGIFDNVCTT